MILIFTIINTIKHLLIATTIGYIKIYLGMRVMSLLVLIHIHL